MESANQRVELPVSSRRFRKMFARSRKDFLLNEGVILARKFFSLFPGRGAALFGGGLVVLNVVLKILERETWWLNLLEAFFWAFIGLVGGLFFVSLALGAMIAFVPSFQRAEERVSFSLRAQAEDWEWISGKLQKMDEETKRSLAGKEGVRWLLSRTDRKDRLLVVEHLVPYIKS